MMKSRIRSTAAIMVMLLASVGLSTAPAQGDGGLALVNCALGSSATTFSPGLLLAPRLINSTVTARYTCAVLTELSFRTGSSSVLLPPRMASCVNPLGTSPASQTIHWNTGGFSTLVGTTTLTTVGNVVVVTGRGVVTAGDFVDRPYVNIAEYTNLMPTELDACLAEPGLTQREGTATLTIL